MARSAVNELTRMVLRVSRDLELIDPKINLRISSQTDLELLCLASELTRKGLGFPQYSNDDVVIPALVRMDMSWRMPRDYVVAACWEFIIPGQRHGDRQHRGGFLPGCGRSGHPQPAGRGSGVSMRFSIAPLPTSAQQVQALADAYARMCCCRLRRTIRFSCVAAWSRAATSRKGLKYNNLGIHGACSANAADALAAVKQFVFDEHSLSPAELLAALQANFAGYEPLRRKLDEDGPKVGSNDDRADGLLVHLFEDFASACEEYGRTPRGGILRPGTGSAMYYIWLARGMRACASRWSRRPQMDGCSGEPFSANLAPSPGVRVRGPISTLQSFSKIDYRRICNGGPITMELSDTVFRDPESIRKVAMLVRIFVQLGCQQLQLNSLNVETLLDAKAHPEKHKNLIVRVWGWSGYFCELAPEYQDHIIARSLYQVDGIS